MLRWWHRIWADRRWAWLIAAGLAVAALLIRLLLNRLTGNAAPYLTFFLAAAISAWQGGLWPGIAALVLGGLFETLFFPSGGGVHIIDPADQYGPVRYLVAGGFVCWICQALIASRDKARAAEQRLRESESLLRAQADALRQSNSDLEQFAFVASHDMQEPLRMVNIYSELLLRNLDTATPEQMKTYRSFIQSGVSRMENLIRDLLRYSRVIHGELEVSVVDANAAAAEALEAVRAAMDESAADVVIGNLPAVRAAESPLTQVFQNLLSNAIKYRKDGVPPVVHVTGRIEGDVVVFQVSDNGIGFEPQFAMKIFGLFTRLSDGRQEGTGLGLAICKRIVERYGGTIWAESAPGEGAKIFFTLPCETRPAARVAIASASGEV